MTVKKIFQRLLGVTIGGVVVTTFYLFAFNSNLVNVLNVWRHLDSLPKEIRVFIMLAICVGGFVSTLLWSLQDYIETSGYIGYALQNPKSKEWYLDNAGNVLICRMESNAASVVDNLRKQGLQTLIEIKPITERERIKAETSINKFHYTFESTPKLTNFQPYREAVIFDYDYKQLSDFINVKEKELTALFQLYPSLNMPEPVVEEIKARNRELEGACKQWEMLRKANESRYLTPPPSQIPFDSSVHG